MGTRSYLLSKVMQAVFTLLFILVFNFFLFRVLPGDPARILARDRGLPKEAVDELRADFGLTKPLPQQFLIYMQDTVTGNFGISFAFRVPVVDKIQERVWPTVLLVGVSTIASTIIGLLIGIYGGWRRGSGFDVGSLGFSLVMYSMPEFWLGILLLIALAAGAGLFPAVFPTGGIETPNADLTGGAKIADVINHLFLPGLTLTVAFLGEYALIMRSSLLDVMGEDYVTTARAKGLREALVLRRHVVPNAMLPTVTLTALNLGFVISGAITVETVFSWPGLGLLSLEAVDANDFPLLQGLFLLFSIAIVISNLTADVIYSYLDPRVRGA
ncbi:MAG: ABC transporter permease [Actinobacteria bacterium]|nr:ABC transporter permease [Actinomycetota bacterium]